VRGQRGTIQLSQAIGPQGSLVLVDPGRMNLQDLRFVAVQNDSSERLFEIALPAAANGILRARLAPGDNGLVVENGLGQAQQLNISVTGFSEQGAPRRTQTLNIPSRSDGSLSVQDFKNLSFTPSVRTMPAPPQRVIP
jgi:hypothetical protein